MNYWQQTFASKSLRTTFDDELNLLTEKIIEFRRFENECFSQSFSMIDFQQRKQTIEQWFFILFDLLGAKSDANELRENLHQFFRSSSLGDLKIRLEISQSCEKFFPNETLAAVRFYYEQFVEHFDQQIQTSRKPVETELKEFFRIQRWKDTNYFSLKNSIDKSKKFLFKSMKKYKRILHQSGATFFLSYELPARPTILTSNDEFFRRIETNFNRKVFSAVEPPFLRDLAEETKNFARLCSTISAMKITTTDRKEVKQMFTEKRQLLTQLFQKLTSVGFSFRKGLTNLQRKTSFFAAPIDFAFVSSTESSGRYATICTKKKQQKLFIERRDDVLTKFVDLLQQTNVEYSRLIFQNEKLKVLSVKTKVDAIVFDRIRGFAEHSMLVVQQEKLLLAAFLRQFDEFSRQLEFFSQIDSTSNSRVNLSRLDLLAERTVLLVERTKYLQLLFESLRQENSSTGEKIPQLDETPNYLQFIEEKQIFQFIDEFLRQLNELLAKINVFSAHRLVEHRQGGEIRDFHRHIAANLSEFEKIFGGIFLDEIRFGNDQFVGQHVKDLRRLFREFASIDVLEERHGETRSSPDAKAIRRFKKRLVRSLDELVVNEENPSSKLPKIFEFFAKTFQKFELKTLTELIPRAMSTETRPIFAQIQRLVDQILFRLIYFHRCSIEIGFAIGQTFVQLMKDGFQMPPEEDDGAKDDDENEKAEGGVSGMDDAKVGENARDVSDEIETEDQLDQTKLPEEKQDDEDQGDEQNESVENEQNGIEVSFDFDAKLDDVQPNNEEEEEKEGEGDEDGEDEENVDDQMGEVDEEDQGEKFDEEKWKNEEEEEERKRFDRFSVLSRCENVSI